MLEEFVPFLVGNGRLRSRSGQFGNRLGPGAHGQLPLHGLDFVDLQFAGILPELLGDVKLADQFLVQGFVLGRRRTYLVDE